MSDMEFSRLIILKKNKSKEGLKINKLLYKFLYPKFKNQIAKKV